MKIDHAPRAGGKTTRLIAWLSEKPRRLLITFSERESERLRDLYPDLANRICTWNEYRERRGNAWALHPEEIALDNADIILQSQARDPISIISLSDETP